MLMPAGSAHARAEQLIADTSAPTGDGCGQARAQVAWALKDICYAAWSSAPDRAQRAAAALRGLCRDDAGADDTARAEVRALADWTEGIAQLTRGQLKAAVACFDAAARRFEAIDRSHAAVLTQVPKIMALSMLGEHAAAAECAEITQGRFVAEGDLLAAAKVSLNLGSLQLLRDEYASAVRHYRAAAVHFARVGDREHSVMADVGMADALTAQGDFDEALRIYARARMRAQAHGLAVLEAVVDESVALLQLVRGRYPDALQGLEHARRRYEALRMPQQLAVAEKQLADVYLELRLLPEALSLFDAALAAFDTLGLRDEHAWASAQRGRALALLGRPQAAGEAFADAAQRFAAQGNAVGEASVALARAELALAAGDAPSARAAAERAAAAFAAHGRGDAQARAELVVAETRLAEGDLGHARTAFDATLQRASAAQLVSTQVRCWTGKALVAIAAGERPAARLALETAVELFEDQRAALPDDALRSAFLADHLRPFRELLRLALDAHDEAPDAERAADVLHALERMRARAIDAPPERPRTGDADDARLLALRERLNWLYRRVQRQRDEGQPSAPLVDEMRAVERELLERARRQRLAGPQLQTPASAPIAPPLPLSELREALADGDALVEYGVLDDELLACIVTRRGVVVRRRLAAWSTVRDALRSMRFQVETLRHGAAPVERHLDQLTRRMQARLAQLHALVWRPLQDTLPRCGRVLIVPHGPLGALPFAALPADGVCVGAQHQIVVAASARAALRGLRRRAAAARRALVVGESSRLAHAAAEARQVAARFDDVSLCVGADATLAALRTGCAGADVVHLACHAQFRHDNPRFSALHLADGALTAEAAESLPLDGALVVLSACETALADDGDANDGAGLVRAFLQAGAARVLASLWPVDDAVTAAFMTRWYAALRSGAAPAAALQTAQQALREQHPHPAHWSAFVLHGGW